ncbi:MAG: hypothetical protein MR384_06805 [Lachnospiraceae bacterium]|nr:hypothetical protein [Lachnospiraceae bacterium]
MKKTMTTNIGTINLAEMELMTDCIEVFIPITAVSENLKSAIKENIKKAKEEWQNKCLNERGIHWSDAGVNLVYQDLHISMEVDHISYELCFNIEDKNDNSIETGFNFEVDLMEYSAELKKIILNAITEKFFS